MCWIVWFHSKDKNLKKDLIRNFNNIKHRWIIHNVKVIDNDYLWYSRLPTDDLSNNNLSKIEDFLYNWIVTNTDDLIDIYNLSKELGKSDTDVLKEWFRLYNKDFLKSVRWMFAFVYITEKNIYLVRDTIWIKPLYYFNSNWIFWYSSEVKWIMEVSWEKNYITEVLPWEIIIFDKETFKIKKEKFTYKSYKNYNKKVENIKKCLEESLLISTKRYLKQTDKIWLLLSWWVDSSILLKLLLDDNQIYKSNIHIFTLWTYDSWDKNIVLKLAKEYWVKVNLIKPYSDKKAFQELKNIIYSTESFLPRVIKVAILQNKLASEIKKLWINVIISWEWADELFYWYDRFYLWKSNVKKLFSTFFKKVFFYTLIQRLDRSFSRYQIEARVPFLDQELIELSKKFSLKDKVNNKNWIIKEKIPLRKLAKNIWLPDYIYNRPKVKMTKWVTNNDNTQEDIHWYLEKFVKEKTWKSTFSLFSDIYFEIFSKDWKNILKNFDKYTTEEDLSWKYSY